MLFCTVSSRVQYTINCTLSHKQTELGKFSEKIFATKLPLLEEREKRKTELKKNTEMKGGGGVPRNIQEPPTS
jgi:hypothetical protein